MHSLDLHHVSKTYRGGVHALRGISLQVNRGEIFGLLGPNGAGKSTLVKIIMTVVCPTRAEGTILGQKIGHKPTLARVGYLPENHRFPRYLTGRQTIEFFAAMSKVDRATARKRTTELLETVRMSEWADRKVSTYSKGMLQRIGLAQALVNDPELVLLDEPTDGVDPVGRREVLDVLGKLREQGTTVFINSHALSELETICDRVAILVQGQVAKQGTIDELGATQLRYEVELAMTNRAVDQPRVLSICAKTCPGKQVEMDAATIRIATEVAEDIQPLLDALRSERFVIVRVQQMRPTLEDLFLATVGNASDGRGAVGAYQAGGKR